MKQYIRNISNKLNLRKHTSKSITKMQHEKLIIPKEDTETIDSFRKSVKNNNMLTLILTITFYF